MKSTQLVFRELLKDRGYYRGSSSTLVPFSRSIILCILCLAKDKAGVRQDQRGYTGSESIAGHVKNKTQKRGEGGAVHFEFFFEGQRRNETKCAAAAFRRNDYSVTGGKCTSYLYPREWTRRKSTRLREWSKD